MTDGEVAALAEDLLSAWVVAIREATDRVLATVGAEL